MPKKITDNHKIEKKIKSLMGQLTEIRALQSLIEKKEKEFNDEFNPMMAEALGKPDGALLEIFKAGFELGQK